jgi:DNA-binding transcriptional LysR family regulator
MKGMEEMLGTALLERHRRGVRPTPAGHALFHHSQLVLAQMERLRGDLREHARGGMRGHIRLISNTTALEEYLPDVLAGWLATNPGVDIALEERLSYEIAPAVAQGHADIGVLVPADSVGVEGMETFPFRIDRLVVIVPRGHALAGRRNIAFVDLLDEEFVGLAAGSALAEHLAWQSTRLGRSLKPRIRLRGLDAVCRMVESGVGIAVVPETAAIELYDMAFERDPARATICSSPNPPRLKTMALGLCMLPGGRPLRSPTLSWRRPARV